MSGASRPGREALSFIASSASVGATEIDTSPPSKTVSHSTTQLQLGRNITALLFSRSVGQPRPLAIPSMIGCSPSSGTICASMSTVVSQSKYASRSAAPPTMRIATPVRFCACTSRTSSRKPSMRSSPSSCIELHRVRRFPAWNARSARCVGGTQSERYRGRVQGRTFRAGATRAGGATVTLP